MAPNRVMILAASGVAALALGGCGGDDSRIPARQADAMIAHLNQIESAVDAQDCDTAQTRFGELQGTLAGLGEAVDQDTQNDLTRLAAELQDDLNGFCAEVAAPEEEPEPEPEPVEPPPEEVPPPPEDEFVPEETEPPGQGQGQGQGQGGGQGGGQGPGGGGISPEDD